MGRKTIRSNQGEDRKDRGTAPPFRPQFPPLYTSMTNGGAIRVRRIVPDFLINVVEGSKREGETWNGNSTMPRVASGGEKFVPSAEED